MPDRTRLGGLRQVVATLFARLRFVAILSVIGLAIVKWDLLLAYSDKYARPADTAAQTGDPTTEYFCPMHPSIIRDTNKEKCPICFMPLSKRDKGHGGEATLPAGVVSRVQLSPYRVVLAGVKTAPVAYQTLTKEIETVGTVVFDERGLKHVAARVKGRIDTLLANETGQLVKKGDELARLYSPDLVVTVQNLLDARRSGNRILERGARERLTLWGIDAAQIDRILTTGEPVTQITVRSPIDGFVTKKYQVEGRYVEEGTPLYDVADLSTVWIEAQVYEDDLSFLPAGSGELAAGARLPVAATTPAYPGETFAGTLSFLMPKLDPASRTLTARFVLANAAGRLKPGMTATVTLAVSPRRLAVHSGEASRYKLDGDKLLAVPEASVIDTGARTLVYREESPGVYEGVQVDLGPRLAGPLGTPYFPVFAGVKSGETVVAAGSFLVDAETRLNPAAGSIYIGGSGGATPSSTVRPSTPENPQSKVASGLAKLPAADRVLAKVQAICPVLDSKLGSMGAPVKVELAGEPVFLCCAGCVGEAKAKPDATLAKVAALKELGQN